MKIFLVLALAIIAASAEELKTEEAKPMEMEWKAKYGEYGIESIVPLQYEIPSYRFMYPSVSYPSVPYPIRVALKRTGTQVTSFDPEFFSGLYGYYPDH